MLDFDTLNDEQLRAVLHTEGPLLVLAGAGSGKTRVITYRLANLIAGGIPPKNILCVTFTNKAAFEMRTRARALVGRKVRGTTMSTFHALGSKILRTYPDRVGLKKGFTISDASEQLGYFRRLLRELRIDDRRFDAKRIMAMISRAKNAGLDAQAYRAADGKIEAPAATLASVEGKTDCEEKKPKRPRQFEDDAPDEEYTVAAIESYAKYERGLRAQNVVDFDDLLLLTSRLLDQHDEVRQELQDNWQYLMIDEYQDTNGAQMDLMRLIAGGEKNLCVVGDDDQSIYGWRGADIANILGFEKNFPGAQTIKLELNYRSTGSILNVANAIIAQNTQRHDKTLRAFAGPGDPIRLVAVEDEEVEAEQVAEAVASLLAGEVLPREVAVLFRSNVQSRPIELAFRRAGIPYRVAGGMELFDRREVKDALAYLRVLDNPSDEQSLRRIINYPARGIGDTTLTRIDDWARSQDLTLWDGLKRVWEVPKVNEKTATAVSEFVELLEHHRKLLGRRKVSTVTEKLYEAVDIETAVFASVDDPQSASRKVDNVREIHRQVVRFEQRARRDNKRDKVEGEEDASADLTAFLADLALGSRDDGNKSEDKDLQVVLSTIHAAKGLEWRHVFLVGAEEELLPHQRTLEGDGEIEEERRLAYVAVTRAREQLTVTWAKSRTRWGKIIKRTRSRFFEDLPEEFVVVQDDDVVVARSEEEREAIAQKHIEAIRRTLGM